jgi:hypothetical protein
MAQPPTEELSTTEQLQDLQSRVRAGVLVTVVCTVFLSLLILYKMPEGHAD